MVRIKKAQPKKTQLAGILSQLTDGQATPALKKHIMTKYIGRRQPLTVLDGVIDRLKLVAAGTTKYDVKTFQDMAPARARPGKRMQTGILEWWQVDKRTGKMRKYEMAITSRMLGMLTKRKFAVDADALAQAQRAPAAGESSAAAAVRAWLLNVTLQEIGEDAAAWEKFLAALHVENPEAWGELQNFASAMMIVELKNVANSRETEHTATFQDRVLRDTAVERYIAHPSVSYALNAAAACITDIVSPRARFEASPYPDLLASCMPQAILMQYGARFDAYKRRYPSCDLPDAFDMDYISRRTLGRPWDGGDVQISLLQAAALLNNLGIGLEVYDLHSRRVMDSPAPSPHHAIRPNVMRVVYHNDHVERVSVVKVERAMAHGAVTRLFVHDAQAIVTHLREATFAEPKTTVDALYTGDLTDLTRSLLSAGYSPHITTQCMATVTRLTFPDLLVPGGGKVTLTIASPCVVRGVSTSFADAAEYDMYKQWEARVTSVILDPRHGSRMSDAVQAVFDRVSVPVLLGCVTQPCGQLSTPNAPEAPRFSDALDFNKFYASCLRDAPFLPAVSPFFEFEACGHADDLGHADAEYVYVVHVLERHPVYSGTTLMFGHELAYARKHVCMRVVARLEVINVRNVARREIARLFDAAVALHDDHKKAIVNKAIGLLGKKTERVTTTVCARDECIARMYPGTAVKFSDDAWLTTEKRASPLAMTFRPVHAMVLGMARLKLFALYNELRAGGARVLGFRTDCVYFDGPHAVATDGGVGGLKALTGKTVPTTPIARRDTITDLFGDAMAPTSATSAPTSATSAPTSATSAPTSATSAPQPRGVLRLGKAGTGKTYGVLSGFAKRDKVLVVCAWNAQARNAMHKWPGVTGITLHTLFGLGVDDRERRAQYDTSRFSDVVFDEILLHKHRNLCRIRDFVRAHSNALRFHATGDHRQLEAIDDVVSNATKVRMLRGLFETSEVTTGNVRLPAHQRERMLAFESDIESGDMSVAAIVREHFSGAVVGSMQEVTRRGITRAVAYFNNTSDTLNAHFARNRRVGGCRKVLSPDVVYAKHDRVICKNTCSLARACGVGHGACRVYPNYEFTVETWKHDVITLRDVLDEAMYTVSADSLLRNFAPGWCTTVHSAQGRDIAKPFVIADFTSRYVSKQWLYTAVSRAVNLDHVFFLDADLTDVNAARVAAAMVVGYRQQDIARFGDVAQPDYVTPEYVLAEFDRVGGKCMTCGQYMSFECRSQRKVTVNRLNNALAHHVDNCELACLKCNSTLK